MKLRTRITALALFLAPVGGPLGGQDCLDPLASWPYGVSNDVAAEGDLALLANGAVLQVVDLTDPSAPAILSVLDVTRPIEAVALSGDRGYVLTNRLHVIDLSSPATPSEMGVLEGFRWGGKLAVVGDLVHVLDYHKLSVVDAGTPSAPVVLGELEWPDVFVLDLAAVSDYVFLTAGDDGLRVVDVSDPTTPTEVAAVYLGAETSAQYLDLVGDSVYISAWQSGTAGDRFAVVDVTDPVHPIVSANVLIPSGGGDIVVTDGLAHIFSDYSGVLHIYDVTVPQTPIWQGSATIPRTYRERLAAIDDHILVTTYLRGLTVVETTDPTDPTPVGGVDAPGRSWDAASADGVLFIATEGRGLRMVDVSDPAQPVELGYSTVVPFPAAISIRGDLAYVAAYTGHGLVVLDISNPPGLTVLGNAPGITGEWIAIAGDHAYLASSSFGIYVVDVTTPSQPVHVGTLDLPHGTGERWQWPVVSGDHLFVRNNYSDPSVAIIDVGDPTTPTLVGSIDVSTNVAGLAGFGRWLLVPDFDNEPLIRIFDVGNPTAPVEHDPYLPVSGYAEVVEISGSVAYLSIYVLTNPPDYTFAVEAVDFGDPAAPEFMGVSSETWMVNRLDAGPNGVFAVSLEAGFDFFSLCQGPLFADGFESGDTSAWAEAAP